MHILNAIMLNRNRSVANLITGVLYQAISITMGLILPYLFITNFGSETNGLLSTIGQIFVYLDLLEAGVGTVSRQALYKPITQNNKSEINKIISATHKYYVKTGMIYALLLGAASVIFPNVITTAISKTIIFKLILLYGAGSVWRFFFQAKYAVFLRAEGKLYVLNNMNLTALVFRNAGKIIAIALGYDVVTVVLIQLIVNVLESIAIIAYVKKKYPWLSYREEPNFKAINQRNAAFIQYVTWMVFNHTDVLLLTFIAKNLALVSVYSIYLLVFEGIQNFLDAIRTSVTHKLGWKAQTSERELRDYFIKYEAFYLAIVNAFYFITYILITPFLRLYVGSVQDIDYMLKGLPLLFLIMKILYSYRFFNQQLVEIVGHFKRTQYIAVTEMLINILTSLVLVYKYNIYGVLMGTIIALVFSVMMYVYYNARYVLKTDCGHTLIEMIVYTGVGAFLAAVIEARLPAIHSYREWVIAAVPVTIVIVGGLAITAFFVMRVLCVFYNVGRKQD